MYVSESLAKLAKFAAQHEPAPTYPISSRTCGFLSAASTSGVMSCSILERMLRASVSVRKTPTHADTAVVAVEAVAMPSVITTTRSSLALMVAACSISATLYKVTHRCPRVLLRRANTSAAAERLACPLQRANEGRH